MALLRIVAFILALLPVAGYAQDRGWIKPALQALVDDTQATHYAFNTFYVPKGKTPVVLWVEANTLILLEDSTPPRRKWDLSKDVVPLPDDVASSTYLISREQSFNWIGKALAGKKIIIHPKTGAQ